MRKIYKPNLWSGQSYSVCRQPLSCTDMYFQIPQIFVKKQWKNFMWDVPQGFNKCMKSMAIGINDIFVEKVIFLCLYTVF